MNIPFYKIKYLSIFIVFSILMGGCAQNNSVKTIKPQNPEFEKFNWLIGKWNAVSATSHYEETWSKSNDSTLTGFAFMITKKDTIFSEKLHINCTKKGIFYNATVANQNNGEPVSFRATKNERGLHVFENPMHNFPQKIMYLMKSPYQLLATVSGEENGKFRKEDFQLKKMLK